MADNKNDLQAIAASALGGVPSFLKSGLSSNLKVVQAAPETAYDGHRAIASIADNDPNTLRIHEADLFRKATPAQRTALLAHELTHRQMDQAAPGIKFAAINQDDPYSYDENNLKGQPITKFSGEQLARMVETNTAYQNDPNISPTRKAQVAAQYAPIIAQLQKLPQATIDTQQPAGNAINTTANAPTGVQFDAAPLVQPTEAGPSAPQGSGNQNIISEDDIHPSDGNVISDDDIAPPTHAEENRHNLREGFKGVGKLALGTIVGDPSVASINPLVHARQNANDAELSGHLQSSNSEQAAGKVAAGGAGLLLGAGPKTVDSLQGGVRSLTQEAKGRMGNLLESNISSGFHRDLGNTLEHVASEAGVKVEPTSDVRKMVTNVASAIRDKAKEKLDQVDELFQSLDLGNDELGVKKYSDLKPQMDKATDALQQLKATSPRLPGNNASPAELNTYKTANEKVRAAQQTVDALRAQQTAADAAFQKQGLDPAIEETNRLFDQADALDKLRKAHATSTFGAPGAGQTNPVKFQEPLNKMHESGQLQTALGEDHAEDLMDANGRAARLMKRNSLVKKGLVATGAAKLVLGHHVGAALEMIP